MNLTALFTAILAKVHMPDEKERLELQAFMIQVIKDTSIMKVNNWSKLKTALALLRKVKLPTNIKMILIHLVVESIKGRG